MKQVEITVSPKGEITIDAQGFSGADCTKATEALSKALGEVSKETSKPERFTRTTTQQQAKR